MFFVMKISKLCNLRCTYCYEYGELALRDRMPVSGLEPFFAGVAAYYVPHGWRQRLTFVLHGGEPLLLPDDYLRGFCGALERTLGAADVPYRVSLQSNLTRLDRHRIDLLEELGISLGVSLDVFGGERVDRGGRDSQHRVMENLQLLFDTGAVERLGVGAISVLHRGNIAAAVRTFRFYRDLGLGYRVLPVFSLGEPPARMRHLTLEPEEVVRAFQAVVDEQFAAPSGISVFPIANYLDAAVSELAGLPAPTYDPAHGEWALIVNTNGDSYNHGDSYSPAGYLGNIFRDGFADVMDGPARRRTLALRAERNATCAACPHADSCSRLPIVEALPSERFTDAEGRLRCAITRPMIDYVIDRIRRSPDAMALVSRARPSGESLLTV